MGAEDSRWHSCDRYLRTKGGQWARRLERWEGGSQALGGLMGRDLFLMTWPFPRGMSSLVLIT